MTPKEKAIELVNEYMSLSFDKPIFGLTTSEAKRCALIVVDEMLKDTNVSNPFEEVRINFWLDVRLEIEKL